MSMLSPLLLQGVFQAAYLGLGVGLGGLVGGLLMETLGGQALFTHSALLVLAGCAAGVLAEHTLGALKPNKRGKHKVKMV
jgi:predicted MFS family arabinose efflux permease